MSFALPVALWGLLLVPLAVVAYARARRRRHAFAVRFTNLHLLASVAGGRMSRRRYIPPALFLLAIASLVVGLARPHATVYVPREEATIVLALDSSASMREPDVAPNRLAAAQQAANVFLGELPERFQVGLVSFSGESHVLAQPTTDRITVREGIASLEADGTTAIGDAIVDALSMDPRSGKSRRPRPSRERPLAAILLLSDGSNTAGRTRPLAAAARAAALRVPVFTVALGPTPEQLERARQLPTPFPTSPPDHATLSRIAEMTDGEFFGAPTRAEVSRIYETLGSRLGLVKDRQEITFAFAAAGLVLAAAGATLSVAWTGRFP